MTLDEPDADSWVVLVTLGTPGSRSHFFVVPRHHVTAAMLAYAATREDQGAGWTRKYFGPGEFRDYDEAWDLMKRPAVVAPWLMPDWVVYHLRAQGREEVLACIPTALEP